MGRYKAIDIARWFIFRNCEDVNKVVSSNL